MRREQPASREVGLPTTVFSQSPHHVLHVHDGIVHDFTQSNRQSTQRHGIERDAEGPQDQHRTQERQRNRRQADDDGAPLKQEGDQNQRDQDTADDNRHVEVADGPLDKGGLLEERCVKRDAFRYGILKFGNRFFDIGRNGQRVEERLLVNQHQHAGLAVDRGISWFIGGSDPDLRNVSQRNRHSTIHGDRHRGQVFHGFDLRSLPDGKPLV